MPNELRPCPFCGNTDLEVCTSPTNSKKKYIRCRNDLCHYGAYTQKIDREMGWNKRPIEDALQARIDELEAELVALKPCSPFTSDGNLPAPPKEEK